MNPIETSDTIGTGRQTANSNGGLAPFLVVGAGWLLLAVVALTFRVPSPLWAPIFDWAASQAVLTEQLIPNLTRWETYCLWAIAYLLLSLAAWAVLGWLWPSRGAHRWRRAVIFWLGIQVSYAILSATLIARGVIGE
jgi:hypothetical protein